MGFDAVIFNKQLISNTISKIRYKVNLQENRQNGRNRRGAVTAGYTGGFNKVIYAEKKLEHPILSTIIAQLALYMTCL